MSLTTKSESVPVVETNSSGLSGPARVTSAVSDVGLVDEHVGAAPHEALIVGHVLAGHVVGRV
jgi:hypothetical protein